MTTYFHLEIDKIKEEILKLGGLAEEAVDRAAKAMQGRDNDAALEVIQNDIRIDELENQIDQRCINLLATHQPVAVDLRFLTSALRICAILERIGDQGVNLAQRALALNETPPLPSIPYMLEEMAAMSMEMTRDCLDAFVNKDMALANEVWARDDELDDLNRRLLEEMITWIMEKRLLVRQGVEIILAARHFERIGDQATNVSEAVIFIVEGTIIRHQGETGRL